MNKAPETFKEEVADTPETVAKRILARKTRVIGVILVAITVIVLGALWYVPYVRQRFTSFASLESNTTYNPFYGNRCPADSALRPKLLKTSSGNRRQYTKSSKYSLCVHALQTGLNTALNDGNNLKIDGWFGSVTRQKVSSFQSQQSLQGVTAGVVDKTTWDKIDEIATINKTVTTGDVPPTPSDTNQSTNSPSLTPPSFSDSTPILILGDSLVVGAVNYGGLSGKLKTAGFTRYKIVREIGRPISWGSLQLRKSRSTGFSPGRIFMELGTNDLKATTTQQGYQQKIDNFMNEANGVPVMWSTGVIFSEPGLVSSDTFKKALDESLKKYPNLSILDWASYAKLHREWVGVDKIHYSRIGSTSQSDCIVRGLKLQVSGSTISCTQ